MKHRLLLAAALALVTAACSRPSVLVQRPTSPDLNRDVTLLWARDIHRVAQTGDWILTRSYSLAGDAITVATGGEPISHASIYDARTGTVIEAITPVVREVPLEDLLERNRYAIIVRPGGLTEAERLASVERARGAIGTSFDFGGLVGLSQRDRFYCSELLFWAADLERRHGARPWVITPVALMDYGEVVYYSGARDDERVQEAARSSRRLTAHRAITGGARVSLRSGAE